MSVPNSLNRLSEVRLPAFESLLAELVAIPSVSSPSSDWDQENLPVINLLADWFSDLGFQVEVQAIPGHKGKANLIATLGAGSHGLVLAGHTDTVPYDEPRWTTDPFKLVEIDQRFYGLGTCDMKGFFPIIIEALRAMEGAVLCQPLIILATADEESSMSGARALAKAGAIHGRAAIIGEPTSIQPIRMHKGIMMESIRVTGQSGHSSNPALGKSAMEVMIEMIAELLQFRDQIKKTNQNELFEVSFPTLNLGRIHGGDSPNRICGHCELSFDLRPLPGMNTRELRENLSGIVHRIAKKRQVDVRFEPLIETVEPFETSATTELVRSCEQLTGRPASAVAFATEAPFLSSMGFETVVMGAGSIDQAHQPDEFLALNQITPMSTVLSGLIDKYCVQPS